MTSSPPASRIAWETFRAHTFSQTRTAADEFGSSSSATSIRSSSLKRPPTSMPARSSPAWTFGSSSVSSMATAVPSASLPTNAMSMTRIVPASTSSPIAGAISPLNLLPGNAMTA